MAEMWWKNAVIYELYVDKFAGDFKGLTAKLGYLKKLGINCIWLLPHYPSPMADDGYDVSDYMGVRQELGNLDDFRKFTETAHEMDIKVIVDLVFNHASIEHPWFRGKKDYFLWSKTGKEFPQAINPFSAIKPSNWVLDKLSGEYYFSTFYPQQADLNWDNPQVFTEMMKVVDFWTDKGVDGFRLDAVPFLIKREGTECVNLPETHQVIKKIRSHVESRSPNVILLAEANGPFERVMEYFGGSAGSPQVPGDECHMIFHFHLMSAMFLALKRGDLSVTEKLIKNSFNIPANCQWATFLRNHDELTLEHVSPARRDELIRWLDPEKNYYFKNGHGASVRLATIFEGDLEKIIGAFKLLLSLPGSPVIYYGDEIGMQNLVLPEKPADSRKYIRGDFDWIGAQKQLEEPDSLLNRVVKLIRSKNGYN